MSAAAIARKRRAESSIVNQNSTPAPNNPTLSNPPSMTQNRNPNTGLTLPQVISVIDTRLIVLETFMKESKDSVKNISSEVPNLNIQENSENNLMEEFETRFDILAGEIADLKDIVLKLQAYTMGVNKTLLEERIHILSDMDDSNKNNQNIDNK
jgi:hypothetical protein